jgi:hypothetical protein
VTNILQETILPNNLNAKETTFANNQTSSKSDIKTDKIISNTFTKKLKG